MSKLFDTISYYLSENHPFREEIRETIPKENILDCIEFVESIKSIKQYKLDWAEAMSISFPLFRAVLYYEAMRDENYEDLALMKPFLEKDGIENLELSYNKMQEIEKSFCIFGLQL